LPASDGEKSVKDWPGPFDMSGPAITSISRCSNVRIIAATARAVASLPARAKPLKEVADWVEHYRLLWGTF